MIKRIVNTFIYLQCITFEKLEVCEVSANYKMKNMDSITKPSAFSSNAMTKFNDRQIICRVLHSSMIRKLLRW